MTDTGPEFLALPERMNAEFVMAGADDPILLATDNIEISRAGQRIGRINGTIRLEWTPTLRIVVAGESDLRSIDLLTDTVLQAHVPALSLDVDVFITNFTLSNPGPVRALLRGESWINQTDPQKIRCYLVNFPEFLGAPVRYKVGDAIGAECARLEISTRTLDCTIDRVDRPSGPSNDRSKPGFLLTHLVEIRRHAPQDEPNGIRWTFDALYWLFAFIRGARTGPILPSSDFPFAQNWISIAPWRIDEPRRVDSWLPLHNRVDLDSFADTFLEKWRDETWNEALRTTIAWYLAANSPSAPSEARITLCQIALEVLSSLQGLENGAAGDRIRRLLQTLEIPIDVPSRLEAFFQFAESERLDAPGCLTLIRNKLEHPTSTNRRKARSIDGTTRMQVAQYGVELLELSLLAILNYRGKYCRRAFRGWKGNDEVDVPWT